MYESFESAVGKFRDFLVANDFPREILWVRPEDVAFPRKRSAYVNLPTSARNSDLARQCYELGLSQKRGILFSAICEVENASCCFVWYPQDDDEANRYLMPADGGLKMSVPSGDSRVTGKIICNFLVWKLFQKAYGNRAPLYDPRFS